MTDSRTVLKGHSIWSVITRNPEIISGERRIRQFLSVHSISEALPGEGDTTEKWKHLRRRSETAPEDFVKQVAILHITRIERLPAAKAR